MLEALNNWRGSQRTAVYTGTSLGKRSLFSSLSATHSELVQRWWMCRQLSPDVCLRWKCRTSQQAELIQRHLSFFFFFFFSSDISGSVVLITLCEDMIKREASQLKDIYSKGSRKTAGTSMQLKFIFVTFVKSKLWSKLGSAPSSEGMHRFIDTLPATLKLSDPFRLWIIAGTPPHNSMESAS